VLADAHRTSSFGVAFSGGGIRSATFNLGVLQGLAEKRLLRHVDILSTVSGGGYIGSWLHALIRNHGGGQPAQVEEYLRDAAQQQPGTPDDDPIMFLRSFSNYLAPRPGLFSADTWTMVLIWVRNVLLNQLLLAPALAALIALALAAVFAAQRMPESAWIPAALVALVALGAAIALLVVNLRPIAKQSTQPDDGRIQSDHPAAAGEAAPQKPIDDGSVRSLWIVLLVLVSAIALGTSPKALSGLAAWSIWDELPWLAIAPVTVALMVALQYGGGFVDCYTARHGSRTFGWLHVVWMSAVAGVVTALALSEAGVLVASWEGTQWHVLVLIFGPPLMLVAILISVMLLIGLMGADYPDAAREWTARTGARLAIAAGAWTVLFALAVLGPWGVSRVLVKSRTIGIATIFGWLATVIGGALAGSSGKTDGAETSRSQRLLGVLTSVAPTIFLVGYVVLLATGVQTVLDRAVPPAVRSASPLPTMRYDVDVRTPEGSGVEVRVNGSTPGWFEAMLEPIDVFERGYPGRLQDGDNNDRLAAAAGVFLLLAVVALIASARININEFSLHHFYKNRLVRCYLGASNRARQANGLTGFDPRDDFPLTLLTPSTTRPDGTAKPAYFGPYAIVNTAVNLNTGSELAQQERKAASFVFTPRYCGFDPSTREHVDTTKKTRASIEPPKEPSEFGYRDTWGYGSPSGPSLGTTFAISGAAANPNWGYHTSGPVAFLLTVFNARLGAWLGNPRWSKPSSKDSPTFALGLLFAELLGLTTKRTKFVNLSDGGHFENLGLYELIRRRTRFIIVCDAEEDGALTFGSLGGVVRKVRADFGVEIDIDPAPIRRSASGLSGAHCVVGTVTYPEVEPAFAAGLTGRLDPVDPAKETRRARGWLLYLKSSLTGDEPADVVEYQSEHAEFPHESTADQFFSESQFESYRRLGLHVCRSAFDGVKVALDPRAATTGPKQSLADQYPLVLPFQELTRRWYAPIPITPEATTRLANEYVKTMQRLADKTELEPLYTQLIKDPPHAHQQATPGMIIFGMELFQLMQNVYTEFRLEGVYNQANPRNAGWIQVFYKWLQSDLLYNQIWDKNLRRDYHAIFVRFVDDLHKHGVPDVPPRP
jgi:hypothetical protein